MSVAGEPEVDAFGNPLVLLSEPLSLLALIAQEPDSGLERVRPGVYRVRIEPGESAR